jgi:transcription elongation factor GreA
VKTKPTSKTGISITSPIARAIVGKSVGDVVDVVAPGGKHSYEVMVVRYV